MVTTMQIPSPPRVDPLSAILGRQRRRRRRWGQQKSCFKSAENRAVGSLWMVHHRYTRILCVSKPLWANNAHKVEPNTGPIKNATKSLLILKSPKTNLKFPFLIAKSSPIFSFLQYCRAIGGCYWTKIAKKMKMYKKRKRRKIPKIWNFFKKRT